MKIKKLLFTTLSLPIGILPIGMTSCEKKATDISDILGEDSVAVNETTTYYAALLPKETKEKITWSVDNTNCAIIDENTGELTGIAEGEVNVIATCSSQESLTKSKKVLITPERTRQIDIIGPDEVHLYQNGIEFEAKLTPDYLGDTIKWSVDDEEIATIDEDSGQLTTNQTGYIRVIATSVQNPDVSTGKYIYITNPVPESWKKDDLRIIAFFANQGLDALANAYPEEYASENKQAHKVKNSFIGSVKGIKIADPLNPESLYDYTIRVIGSEYDTIVGSSQKATLTWELDQLLSTKGEDEPVPHRIPWTKYPTPGELFDNAWMVKDNIWSSDVRLYFQQTIEGLLAKTLGKNTIKTVIKKTPAGIKTDDVVESEDKVFALSLNEIYSPDAIAADETAKDKASVYTQCGPQYQFYKEAIADGLLQDYNSWLIKWWYGSQEGDQYWLRTPHVNDDSCNYVWRIRGDGRCDPIVTKGEELGELWATEIPYSFCFCM